MNVRLLRRRFFYRFIGPNGDVREIADPHGKPTPRQFGALNRAGALAIVEPGQVEPITRGEAAGAIDALTRRAEIRQVAERSS